MTVKEFSSASGFDTICMPDPDRVIEGGYAGDLLSWVMGRASASQAWITIMSNINIVAVASLCDVSCIILAENVSLDENTVSVAAEKGVNILKTSLPTFEAVKLTASLI